MTKILVIILLFICFFPLSYAQSSSKSKWWASAEYLYWWTQDSPINVPLATQNSSSFAIINQPGTQIIFGSGARKNNFDFGGIGGARLTIGEWLDDAYRYGIEGSGFGLSEAKQTFTASSVGTNKPILDVPFFSVQSSNENVLVGNRPNTITDSDTFQPASVEVNGLYNLSDKTSLPVILTAGFRFMNINENLRLNDAIYNTPSLPANSVLNIQDQFSTKNNFYGFQVGSRTHLLYEKIDFEGLAEIALGINYQRLNINGETNINNTTVIQPIGLFAEPSNIGTFKRNQFTFLPELELKLGYHINQYIQPFFTYNVIYINHILRASNEIDRQINLSQNPLIGGTGVLSGKAAPVRQFNDTSMWMQGVSLGIQIDLC